MTNEEFNRLPPEAQATLRAGLLMQQLLADSDAAKALMPLVDKAAKKANPSYLTVEDQAAPIVAKVREEFQAELSKRDRATAEERAKTEMQAAIDRAKAEGFTDEGLGNILKVMERGVANFDDAKKIYLSDNPPQPATPPGGTDSMDWNVYETMGSGDQKGFFFPEGMPSITENPEKWERGMALKYLNNQVGLPTG